MQNSLDEKLKKTLASLHDVLAEMQIEAYLIGGQARNIWFMEKQPQPRITRDLDWAILDKEKLAQLKERLLEKENFTKTNNRNALISPDNIQVDMTAFEDSISEDEHLLGLYEVAQKGTQTFDFEGKSYQVATIPAIILLKLIAFSQRPEHRQKDIEDIAYMLHNFDIYQDEIYSLFLILEPEYISARYIGIKIKEIISESAHLQHIILGLLEKQIENPVESTMAQIMVKGTEKTEMFAIQQLSEMLTGLST